MNVAVEGVVLPNKPLSNFELMDAVDKLKIQNFRGVFLRDTLPGKSKKKECGILNLDDTSGSGTHWVAWWKNNDVKFYFDSFGLPPPLEMEKYLKSLKYNTEEIQSRNQVVCGHLCLYVLKHLSMGKSMQNIINNLH